jgi:molybdate transport system substrate-binding protein
MIPMLNVELSILSGGAVQKGLEGAARLFYEETGYRVNISFATAPVLRRKIENQEATPDIVIAPAELTAEFEEKGHTAAGSRAVIGSVKAGVVVRSGAPRPDISTAETLKKEILACQSLVYNEGSSGIFVEKLLDRLGIAEEVKAKTVRLPDADAVMKHLAQSTVEKEIGFGQLTAIVLRSDQGVTLVGPLPKEIENSTTYAAAVSSRSHAQELAQGFVNFLITPPAQAAFKANGVE